MEDKNKIQNKRIIAIALALGVLVLSLLGSNLIQKNQIAGLESEKNAMSYFEEFFSENIQKTLIQGTNSNERILVVPIYGNIGEEGSSVLGQGSYNHENILSNLDLAIEDPTIQGIILDINTPGGTVYHSAEIWHKIKEVQESRDLPIYASMGLVAASGGYYVAAPADKIYASSETTTGSIGVISTYTNVEELAEKIGLKQITFKSDTHKDIGSSMREMTDEEKQIIQAGIDEMYQRFLDVVEDGRGEILSRSQIERLADGRTYSGSEAVENGLIDEIGYFDQVVDAMIEDLGIDDPEVFKMESPTPSISSLIPSLSLKEDSLSEIGLYKKIKESGLDKPGYYYIYGGY